MEDKKNTPNNGVGKRNVKPGDRFGRLVVIQPSSRKHYYDCVCDCGKTVSVNYYRMRDGITQSCGCLHSDRTREVNSTHGMSKKRVFKIWSNMRNRCNNPNSPIYERYGGRGIKVCKRWDESFTAFLEDMGEPPGDKYSIDRIDNNGNYEPSNCRWATIKEQARNRRSSAIIQFNGKDITLAELAEITGVKYNLLESRIEKYGWTVEEAVSIPSRKRRECCLCKGKPVSQFTKDGELVKEWASMAKAARALGRKSKITWKKERTHLIIRLGWRRISFIWHH